MPQKLDKSKAKPAGGLPSSDEILQFIASAPGKVGKREIALAFAIKGADKIGLKKLLKDLEKKGDLSTRRKGLKAAAGLPSVGLVEVAGSDKDDDLFGYFIDAAGTAGSEKILITTSEGKAPKKGDRVSARISAVTGHYGYTRQAKVMRVIKGTGGKILAVFQVLKGKGARLVPVDKKSRHDYQVLAGDEGGAENGELVAIEITRDRGFGLPAARVVERLGDMNDPRNISLIAINQYGIPNAFPEAVVAAAEGLASFAQAGRLDMTAVPLITIDPIDARDHDDAVYAEPDETPGNPGGFKLTVAIADVATYVKPGSVLDKEARFRGNSVYFPDRVVPMLPERISNDLCSLREKEVRPALACVMRFDAQGHKLDHRFSRVSMRSAAKLSYEEAQAAIDGKPSLNAEAILQPVLQPLWAAYKKLKQARDKRAPLALDLPERKIIMDGKGNVVRVVVPPRLEAHQLIEEFMIQANVAAAEELEKRKTPLLYRVHDNPSPEKIKSLAQFLKTVNRELALGQVVKSKTFNTILNSVKGEDFEQLVHEVVLRSQAQAAYSADNLGHFGLNLARYAHFTSPIRRYPDLIVHRALITALGLGSDGLSQDDIAGLDETAELMSVAERRAMLAERETTDRLIAAYLAPHVGAVFPGKISGVVGAGLFVTLEESGADGFVPVNTLGRDYFQYDETAHRLVGQRQGESFQLGDKVNVKLIEVAPVRGGLRFEMVSEGRQGTAAPRFKKKGRRK